MRSYALALVAGLAGPVSITLAAEAAAPSYSKEIAPFFKKYCTECHNSDRAKAGYDLSSFAGLTKEGRKGQAVVAGEPDTSRALQALEGKAKAMPPRRSLQPDKKDVAKLRDWIKAGAKNDLAKGEAQAAAKNNPMPNKAAAAKANRVRRGDDDDEDDDDRGNGKRKCRGERRRGERDDDD
jgi:hypothetical protein